MRKSILLVVAIAIIALVGFISIQPRTNEENGETNIQEPPEGEEILIPSRETKIPGSVRRPFSGSNGAVS